MNTGTHLILKVDYSLTKLKQCSSSTSYILAFNEHL